MAFDSPVGVITAATVLLVLAIVSVCARFYSRRIQGAPLGWDDWLIVPALMFAAATNILVIYGSTPDVQAFAKPHPITIPSAEKARIANRLYVTLQDITPISVGLVKFSVALFYRRIFASRSTLFAWWDLIINIWLGLIALWTVAFSFSMIFQCGTHFSVTFGPSIADHQRYCSHEMSIYWWFISTDMVMDIITVLLPFPKIYSLNLSLARKIQIALILLVALFSVGGSVGALAIFSTISRGLYTSEIITMSTTMVVWYMIELDVGIIAACLPSCRPAAERITRFSSKIFRRTSGLQPLDPSQKETTGFKTMDERNNAIRQLSSWDMDGKVGHSAYGDTFSSLEATFPEDECFGTRDSNSGIYLRKEVTVESRRLSV